MDITTIDAIKDRYAKVLASDSQYLNDLENLINASNEKPISSFNILNAEDAPSYSVEERELQEILLDLNSLNNGAIEIKNYIDSIFNKIDINIKNVENAIREETERIKDINMICCKNSEYNMVIPIHITDFGNGETFEAIDDRTIGAKNDETIEVQYEILSVNGNGISGNLFVYNNNKFENIENNCGIVSLISDESEISGYVYERLTTNNRHEVIDGIINYDEKEVRCVITLKANEVFCKLKYLTENNDIVLENVETSADGYSWISRLNKPLNTNDINLIYNDSTYIYGSNIICFPYSMFVRLTFSSNTLLDDIIAIEDEDGNPEIYKNTKRKKIKLNKITLYSTKYSDTDITSVDLLESGSVDKIALFATEYLPDHFPDTTEYFKYYLIINGEEYEIVPVNSGKEGIKIIKYNEVANASPITQDVKLIEETIKSAKVRISISSYNGQETGYISNLKVCLGKDTGSIYV